MDFWHYSVPVHMYCEYTAFNDYAEDDNFFHFDACAQLWKSLSTSGDRTVPVLGEQILHYDQPDDLHRF